MNTNTTLPIFPDIAGIASDLSTAFLQIPMECDESGHIKNGDAIAALSFSVHNLAEAIRLYALLLATEEMQRNHNTAFPVGDELPWKFEPAP